MTTIAHNLQAIQASIITTASHTMRTKMINLIAVSKAQPAESIREAFLAGQISFGENYLQEALTKQTALNDLAIVWHFIGPIQSNKTTSIAENFSWVHAVDRIKIANRLNAARPMGTPPLNVCIQVNVSQEENKSGVSISEVLPLAHAINQLPHLKLRGLMTIPAPTKNLALQHTQFKQVADCLNLLNQQGLQLDTLSMGMSGDYIVAIKEGATMVRIGSAIFGKRIGKQSFSE